MKEWNGKKYYTKQEQIQFYRDIRQYNRMRLAPVVKHLGALLLDSSLIFATPKITYTHKVVQCGNYYQVYDYNKKTIKKNLNLERMNFRNKKINGRVGESKVIKKIIILEMQQPRYYQLNIFGKKEFESKKDKKIVIDNYNINIYQNDGFLNWFVKDKDPPEWLHINEPIKKEIKDEDKKILMKNIYRSKIELQRLVKSNELIFKTFITLTFEQNICDIEYANKKFAVWRTKVQSVLKKQKKEFSYICVPEFQKRGAVHYHLLTNLDFLENSDIIIPQKNFSEKQLLEMSEYERKNCYDVKYWSNGYSSVFNLTGYDAVGYISKYMTKDLDNRLWGKRRYLASHNLKTPSTLFLNSEEDRGFLELLDIKNKSELNFESIYSNPLGEAICFQEFKRKEVINSV